jgi:hypothetical protein
MKKAHSLLMHLRAGFAAFLFAELLVLALSTSGDSAHAQSCNPAVVSYLVRDEQGRLLSEADLQSIAAQLPKTIGDAHIFVGEVSLTQNDTHFYWQSSVNWDKGRKVPALQFINAAKCEMLLQQVTLTYHGQPMQLGFALWISRTEPKRNLVIEALPFQAGKFSLRTTGAATKEVIPAYRWSLASDEAQKEPVVNDGRAIFQSALSQLLKATRVPLRLPAYLAAEEETNQLYAVIDELKATSYAVQVAFAPDCEGGNACNYGFVAGAARDPRAPRLKGKPVRLAQGLTGYFIDATCGATCGYSTLSWWQGGYEYTVGIKAAELSALRQMANSAIANSGGQ